MRTLDLLPSLISFSSLKGTESNEVRLLFSSSKSWFIKGLIHHICELTFIRSGSYIIIYNSYDYTPILKKNITKQRAAPFKALGRFNSSYINYCTSYLTFKYKKVIIMIYRSYEHPLPRLLIMNGYYYG